MSRSKIPRRLQQQLTEMENRLRCRVHHRPLCCVDCDAPGFEHFTDMEVERLEYLLGRINVTGKAVSMQEYCPICGGELSCIPCNDPGPALEEKYYSLSTEEQHALHVLLTKMLATWTPD